MSTNLFRVFHTGIEEGLPLLTISRLGLLLGFLLRLLLEFLIGAPLISHTLCDPLELELEIPHLFVDNTVVYIVSCRVI
jgi:hypothetical protein